MPPSLAATAKAPSASAARLETLSEYLDRQLGAVVAAKWMPQTSSLEAAQYDSLVVHLCSWGGRGTAPGHFSDPLFVIPLPEDRVLVSDHGNRRLAVMTLAGDAVQEIGHCDTRPLGIVLGRERLYVAMDDNSIRQFDMEGRELSVLCDPQTAAPLLLQPSGLALNAAGALLRLSASQGRPPLRCSTVRLRDPHLCTQESSSSPTADTTAWWS